MPWRDALHAVLDAEEGSGQAADLSRGSQRRGPAFYAP